jgi:hypothetical protein
MANDNKSQSSDTSLSNSSSGSIRYKLIAQYRNDELLIEILGQGLFMRRTAREVMRTPELLSGLSSEHAAYIGLAAGMALR